MKVNEERIDFLIERDLGELFRRYVPKAADAEATDDPAVLQGVFRNLAYAAYRKGIYRGFEMAAEVDTLAQSAGDEDEAKA